MNVLKQLFNILSWPTYLYIAGYLLTTASMLAGHRLVAVLSGSTEPTFPVGSVIYYKTASFEQIQEGDPIIFYTGKIGSPAIHRVVEKRELSRDFITGGDASETADPNPVSYGRVVGKASDAKIPHAGHFVTYGRTLQAVGVMGGVPVIGILLDFIYPGERQEEKV